MQRTSEKIMWVYSDAISTPTQVSGTAGFDYDDKRCSLQGDNAQKLCCLSYYLIDGNLTLLMEIQHDC